MHIQSLSKKEKTIIMEVKKIKNKRAKTYRSLFFLLGMCISIGSVYALMKYKKYDAVETASLNYVYTEDQLMVEQTAVEKKKEKPKVIPKDIILKVIDDNKKPDDIIIDLTIEPNDDPNEEPMDFDEPDPEPTDEPLPWYVIQSKAEFPGGQSAMDAYIDQNLELTDLMYEEAPSGTVLVSFVIEKDGRVSNVEIISKRKLGYGVEEAVLKVIKKMPKWKPASQRDKPARMLMTKPIRLNFS